MRDTWESWSLLGSSAPAVFTTKAAAVEFCESKGTKEEDKESWIKINNDVNPLISDPAAREKSRSEWQEVYYIKELNLGIENSIRNLMRHCFLLSSSPGNFSSDDAEEQWHNWKEECIESLLEDCLKDGFMCYNDSSPCGEGCHDKE
jgi:hypothetical protein